jgi:hypothetical protein
MQRPLFRTDLVCKAVDAGDGQRMVDVTDPGSGSTFRFYELEYAIACAMDGTRTRDELASWAQAELGIDPEPSELETVITTLDSLGYLTELSDVELAASTAVAAPSPIAPSEDTTAPRRMPAAAPPASTRQPSPIAAGQDGGDVELGAPGRSPVFDRPGGAPPVAAPDIELGTAGLSDPVAPRPAAAATATPVLELGASGRSLVPDAGDEATDFTTEDQPTNVKPVVGGSREFGDEVSVDLSQQFKLDAVEVKEAVRQSRVMQAVEVPAELGEEYEATRPAPLEGRIDPALEATQVGAPLAVADESSRPVVLPEAPAAAATATAPTIMGLAPARPPAMAAEPVRAAAPASAPAAAAPATAATAATAVEPPRKKASVGAIIFLVVLLAVVGAAGLYVYLTYLKDDTGTRRAPRAAVTEPVEPVEPVEPPPPPPPPTATLSAGTVDPTVVVAPQAGVVAWVAEAGAAVDAGAPVVKLAGSEAIEKDIGRLQNRIKFYQDTYDQAAARDDKAAMRAAEADVKRKQGDVDKALARLAALSVAAPAAGVVQPTVAARAQVAAGAEVATITPPGEPVATFASPAKPLSVGGKVEVQHKDDAKKLALCEVTAIDDGGATVSCPADGPLAAGDDVILAP